MHRKKPFFITRASGLIIAAYFIVFAVVPLADIHVEVQSEIHAGFIPEKNVQKNTLLLQFHEILSSYFSDGAEHMRNKGVTLLSLPRGKNKSHDAHFNHAECCIVRNPREAIAADNDYFTACPDIADHPGTPRKGYSVFHSGLSPPHV